VKKSKAQQLEFGMDIFFRPPIKFVFLRNGNDYCKGVNELCACGCRIISMDVKTGGYLVTYHETKPTTKQDNHSGLVER